MTRFLNAYALVFFISGLFSGSANSWAIERFQAAPRETTVGVFYGYIHYLDTKDRLVLISPIDARLPRKSFLVDSKTLFDLDGKPTTMLALARGQKVAVRYFAEGFLAVADKIFVVSTDFQPQRYRAVTKKRER